MRVLRSCLFVLALFSSLAPAHAQFRPDYVKPEVIDPAWFAGVVAPRTDLPVQPAYDACPPGSTEFCVGDNYIWPALDEKEFLGPTLEKLDVKGIAKNKDNNKTELRRQPWRVNIAHRYLRAGRFDLFFPEINDQITKWYSGEGGLLMRADTLAMLGRNDLALADVNAAIFWATKRKHEWALGFMYASKAEILMRSGNKPEAMQAIRMANNLRDPAKFSQYSRIDWANELAFPILYGVSFKSVKDALNTPVETKCKPIPPLLITAQKAQYRNYDSVRQTLNIHDACGEWAQVAGEAQWLIEYAELPLVKKSMPDALTIRQTALDSKVKAHRKLGQYHEAAQTLLEEIVRIGVLSSARPYERQLAQTLLDEKAAGGTPDPGIMKMMTGRIALRQAQDRQEAANYAGSGRIRMCNLTTHTVRMVINYVKHRDGPFYTTSGWHTISSGNCVTYYAEGGTTFYYHAVDSVTFAGWGGDHQICVATTLGDWTAKSGGQCTGGYEARSAVGVLLPANTEHTENLR